MNTVNKSRRARLQKALHQLNTAVDTVYDVSAEEEDSLANIPEALLEGEQAQEMSLNIDTLEKAISHISHAQALIEDLSEPFNLSRLDPAIAADAQKIYNGSAKNA
jgi:hypothetical protein